MGPGEGKAETIPAAVEATLTSESVPLGLTVVQALPDPIELLVNEQLLLLLIRLLLLCPRMTVTWLTPLFRSYKQ